jgi:HTH-type transcriptional regulator / antitoxin HigA
VEEVMATATLNPTRYARLLGKVQPHPIRGEEDYDSVVEQIGQLMEKGEDALSPEETSLLEMLSILISDYDRHRDAPKPTKPGELIAFLLEQRGLQPRDLWDVLGSKSRVSEIISGKRAPTKEQIKKLAAFFHVPADLFI